MPWPLGATPGPPTDAKFCRASIWWGGGLSSIPRGSSFPVGTRCALPVAHGWFSRCLPPLPPPPTADQEADAEEPALAGQGSFKLEGSWLKLRQFHGLIVKRFHCAKRNTKALFSQILLPAFFVCVAMTVALSVPEIGTCPVPSAAPGPGGWTRHSGLLLMEAVPSLLSLPRRPAAPPPLAVPVPQLHPAQGQLHPLRQRGAA